MSVSPLTVKHDVVLTREVKKMNVKAMIITTFVVWAFLNVCCIVYVGPAIVFLSGMVGWERFLAAFSLAIGIAIGTLAENA